jgi:hypothetical protein
MALSGQFLSFNSIIERVYRSAGYQTVDWADAIEHIADVLRLIGVKDSYKTITTNGLDGNPDPIAIVDYRGTLPSGMIQYIAARKVEVHNGVITGFYPLVYSTDLFHQSNVQRMNEEIPQAVLDTTEWNRGLDGEYTPTPIIVVGESRANASTVRNYTYRINATVIETNFEDGFVEMVYNGFVTDCNGFPMIPDDIKFEKAVEAYLIERIDYKKWRRGELSDKVYRKSDQERDWYIAAARSKGNLPSLDKMESWKNAMLRSIIRPNQHSTNFRNLSVQERRKV